jgi:hypothetical protein
MGCFEIQTHPLLYVMLKHEGGSGDAKVGIYRARVL